MLNLENRNMYIIHKWRIFTTWCSLNIVFFRRLKNIFRTLASLGFPSVSLCVHIGSAAAELAEFRKITSFQGKTQYLMNTLDQTQIP